MFSTFYAMEIIQGVSKGLLNYKGVELFIHIERANDPKKEGIPPILNKDIVAGILFADITGNERLIQKARDKKVPFIILNHFNAKSKDNCVGIDNANAAVDVVDYLVKLGHKNIAIINGELKAQAGSERLLGFKKGLKKNGLKLNNRYVVNGDWSEKSGYTAMQKLAKLSKPPTAVFVVGDEMAFGAIRYAKEKGLRIPNDISIVGFDDVPLAASNSINLTTVKQPLYELGNLGIKNIINLVKEKRKKRIKILLTDTQLIIRGSTGVPKMYYW
jgi:LacI family transcriptional regulator